MAMENALQPDMNKDDCLSALNQEQMAREIVESDFRESGNLISSLTHDVKNQLAAIKMRTQFMLRSTQDNVPSAKTQTGLHSMVRQIDTIRELTDQIAATIDTSQSGESALFLSHVDLVDLIELLLEQHRTAEHCEQTLVFKANPQNIMGFWDADKLARAIDNLINNAVKFTLASGIVSVAVSQKEEPETHKTWAELVVEDTGVGIPSDDLPRIFQRFHRGSNVADAFAGSGIGLASARDIIEAHGGAIGVVSTEGAGTKVTVRLPLPKPVRSSEPLGATGD